MKNLINITLLLAVAHINAQEICTITPHKYIDPAKKSHYEIPSACRHLVPRSEHGAPDIIYYLSIPQQLSYPIAILSTGSSNHNSIDSVIHFHRYFLQELLDLQVGVVTVEQWGVDGMQVDRQSFMNHYTRSARLYDHDVVIEQLKRCPPKGWDGKFIFIGCSEGGPLVTALTIHHADSTLATINWSGAGDWNWRDELWSFVGEMKKQAPWWVKLWYLVPRWMPFSLDLPKNRREYDADMDATIACPCAEKELLGMTYLYHADALQWPQVAYDKIRTPYLVVAGAKDSIIDSCDTFVCKAQEAGATITYLRIPDMDHYIRHRPDIIAESFIWLERYLKAYRELSDIPQ